LNAARRIAWLVALLLPTTGYAAGLPLEPASPLAQAPAPQFPATQPPAPQQPAPPVLKREKRNSIKEMKD